MRHLKAGRKLGRTASHRKATMSNLAAALIEHKSIITTTPKAKEARGVVDRLITFAKRGDLAARRQVLRTLRDKSLVKELFDDIAPKYKDRPGGYTRVIKIGNRKGDDAPLALLEILEPGTGQTKPKKGHKKKTAKGKAKGKKEKAQAKKVTPKKQKPSTKETESEEPLTQTAEVEEASGEPAAPEHIPEEAETQNIQESPEEGQAEESTSSDEETDEEKETESKETTETSEDEKDGS